MLAKILPSFVVMLHVTICEINNITILKDTFLHVMLEEKLFPRGLPVILIDRCQTSLELSNNRRRRNTSYRF